MLSITFFSCSSPEKRAQKLVKEDLKQTLHDFKSYEPVSFSELIDAYSDMQHDTDIPILFAKNEKLKEEREKYQNYEDRLYLYRSTAWNTILEYRAAMDSISDLMRNNLKTIEELYNSFKAEKIGLKIKHTYRAKTLGGNFKLTTRVYVFDNDVTEIIRSYEDDK